MSVSIRYGSYTYGMDGNPSLLTARAKTLGRTMSVASVFRGKGDYPYFPYQADYALGVQAGRILLVSWSLEDWGNFSYFSSGRADAMLTAQAESFKKYAGTIVVRPWAEMNGDWVTYQPLAAGVTARTPSGGTPANFIAAWKRVVNIVRGIAPNVLFCFNPTTDTYAETTPVTKIWPGKAYVDVLGLDGYNWGSSTSGGVHHSWTSFASTYAAQYANLCALHPTAPVWVCEVSSADPLNAGQSGVVVTAPAGQSKGQWWIDLVKALNTGFSRVEALTFFDMDKERDWAVDSSAAALAGLKSALATGVTRPVLTV